MKGRTLMTGWRVLVAALFATGAFFVFRYNAPSTTASVTKSSETAGVFKPTRDQWSGLKVEEVKQRYFHSTLITDGNIALNDAATTTVFSPYAGRVTRVLAKLGDVVKQGAPLMVVDASELVQGQSDVVVAKGAYELARASEARIHALYDAGAGPLKDWKQAQSDLASARSALRAARGRLRILGKTESEIDMLEETPREMGETVLRAPLTGTVIQRQVNVGQYIASAASGTSTPVFMLSNLSTVWLVANVRESDVPALRLDMPVSVSVLALPGQTFKGKITWIGSVIDPNTHRLPVRAEVQNPRGVLKAQMFATFAIATSKSIQSPAVPQAAIVYDGENARVYVVNPDNSIVIRVVHVGRNSEGLVEITDGLQVGEKVITSGTLFIDRAIEGN